MTVSNFTYSELKDLYKRNFTLGYIDSKFENKLALISLTSYITFLARKKDPNATVYSMLKKITKESDCVPDEFLWALSIICEDLMYGADDFPTFGLNTREIIPTIQNLLKKYLPF